MMDDNSPPQEIPATAQYDYFDPDDELTELVAPASPPVQPRQAAASRYAADPEFDAYMSVVRLLVGGTVEGTAQLTKRLAQIEADLRAEGLSQVEGEINSPGDITRYMLVGMAISAGDGLRRRARRLAELSDVFARLTGSAVEPFAESRLTGWLTRPFENAFESLVNRGQTQVNEWVELGRVEEPPARESARRIYIQVVDEFISLLAENEELEDLVQQQSVSLATETVDAFRTRTVSADALAEGIVRRILRRPPRVMLPPPPDELQGTVVELEN